MNGLNNATHHPPNSPKLSQSTTSSAGYVVTIGGQLTWRLCWSWDCPVGTPLQPSGGHSPLRQPMVFKQTSSDATAKWIDLVQVAKAEHEKNRPSLGSFLTSKNLVESGNHAAHALAWSLHQSCACQFRICSKNGSLTWINDPNVHLTIGQ